MYEELIKSLRKLCEMTALCDDHSCFECPYEEECSSYKNGRLSAVYRQAADAIEELSQIAAHHEQRAKDYWQEACEYREQIAHLVKEQAALFEPALKSLELSNRPYVLEAPQPRWISVEERLPVCGDVVLCVGDNGTSIADFVIGDKWSALPWFFVDGEQETGVTHWMPLPEPPKEET